MCMHAGAVRDGAWHAHDAVLEMLNLHDQGRGKLGGGTGSDSGAGLFNESQPGAGMGAAGQDEAATGRCCQAHR